MNSTELATLRTTMANQRTYLAVLRTGLSLFGLGLKQDYKPMLVLSLVFLVYGSYEYYIEVKNIKGKDEPVSFVYIALVGLVFFMLGWMIKVELAKK